MNYNARGHDVSSKAQKGDHGHDGLTLTKAQL